MGGVVPGSYWVLGRGREGRSGGEQLVVGLDMSYCQIEMILS